MYSNIDVLSSTWKKKKVSFKWLNYFDLPDFFFFKLLFCDAFSFLSVFIV